MSEPTQDDLLQVNCPSCQTPVQWRNDNAYRPFCSESCKNKDFVDWANEENRLAGSNSYDDIFSDDIQQQPES